MTFDESIADHNSWDAEREKLNEVFELLNANGLNVKAGSRLYRYQRILKALEDENIEDLPKGFTLKKFHQIASEIHQLYTGVVELSNSKNFGEWSDKLSFLISGKELPESDLDYTARNYQFELYIAGLIKKSGLEPLYKEPDIQINQDGRKFGIAIKRSNSFNKLDENLKKGRKQIVKTGVPGIIFVDVTRISNPANYIAYANSVNDVTKDLIRFLDLFYEKNYSSMKNIISHDMVFGIALYASCLCNINGAFGHTSRITIKSLCSETSPYISDLSYFANSLRNVLQ